MMISAATAPPASMARDLEALCPGGVLQNVPLDQISRWRIGGKAALVVRPATPEQLAAIRRYFAQTGTPHAVIGDTSNLLFADEGLYVPCIQIGQRMAAVRIQEHIVEAEAGIWIPHLARKLMKVGLSGAEHACGIPGTLGGLVCMNGGSQRQGIGNSVISVQCIAVDGATFQRDAEDCGFGYRSSVFQENGEIIFAVRLRLQPGCRSTIRAQMRSILSERRRKFPRKLPNCGSVFKSDPSTYADIGSPGAAIERLKLKGLRHGGAAISSHHANFIVNVGGATAHDVLVLIAQVANAVQRETGHRMETEVRYVTKEGIVLPADRAGVEVSA